MTIHRRMALLGRAAAAMTLIGAGFVATAGEASAIAVTRVTRSSTIDSVNKSVTAPCPNGTSLIGTGGNIVGGGGEVLITDIVPSSSLGSVTVAGGENGAYAGNWRVIAVAVCSSAVSSLSRVMVSSSDNGTSNSPRDAAAACTNGEVAVGMGYRLTGAAGNVFPNLLTPTFTPPDLVVVQAFEDLPYAPNWNLDVYAICGVPPGDVVVAIDSEGPDSISPKEATAECPNGMEAVSAGGNNGGQVGGIADDLILERMTPNAGSDSATVRVAENLGVGTNWSVTAYAICVE